MPKIIQMRLGRAGKRRGKLASRPMTSALGKRVQGTRVNAESTSLGDDLLLSFTRSVERARRENKELFGNRDRIDGNDE
jgi:hypothetical protein